MGFHDSDLSHPHRRQFTGESCSLRQSAATRAASVEAIAYAENCLREARLLTPTEALALACGESREKETLYSISRRFSDRDGVDADDLLCDLGERFPDYS